ncbi:MAG: DNA-deoxyinosine glycosylase, partial [Lachnospiraceae bacterium]|nr:DNA-deoxyinosine glycosylase [Lachnospiraceae bacterium]
LHAPSGVIMLAQREMARLYGCDESIFCVNGGSSGVLAAVLGCPVPESTEEKKEMLLSHHIALWDVIDSCDIKGSSDSSIRNVLPADIPGLLKRTQIQSIYLNGQTAGRLYRRFLQEETGLEAYVLPSTSPANAACTKEQLIRLWSCIR